MIPLVIVYPDATFFHVYPPYEENTQYKGQKEEETHWNNRLLCRKNANPARAGLFF